ncbi:MAG: FtsX-like permease family protein [Solirubrobacteraceae bacterium]|jgi:putative ABC transport system permease protein
MVQDLFAIAGIAVGVALLFASQVASTSLSRSVQQLSSQIVGSTQYQLDARGPAGVNEDLLGEVSRLSGVRVALPVLEQQANVIGPDGRQQSIDLIGTNPQFARFGGPLLRRFSAAQLAAQRAIALPNPIANAIGAGTLETIKLQVGAQVITTLLGATLDEGDIGGLVHSPVAIAPVRYAQQITGMTGRITRIFVKAQPGRDSEVLTGLRHLAALKSVNVEPADFDSKLFAVASLPENQSETLFSAISAIVGFMFALNAMLITVPRRRRLLALVRLQGGANRRQARQILLFEAVILGVLACLAGLALGDLLSIAVFHATPGYLSFAFPVGNGRIVDLQSVVISIAAGMAAALVGVLWPLRDVFTRPREHGSLSRRSWIIGRIAAGVIGLAVTTIILVARPQDSKLGNLTLVIALLCALPFLFNGVVAVFAKLQPVLNRPSPRLTLTQLRSPLTRIRSLAIVATGAVAVFGVVSIQGAQQNLQRGLDASAHDIDSSADLWVTPRGESNAFATTPFTYPGGTRALARLAGVRNIRVYRGSFLTWGDRRLWILAPPGTSPQPVPPSEIVAGSLAVASARLREGGWAVISQALAAEHHLHVGQRFMLPAPASTSFRVAALSTNLGWPPGSIIINSQDYARAWLSSDPSAYEIQTKPGVPPASVRRVVQAALGPQTGLVVETASERENRHDALARQGLLRLTQIRLLVLIAAMLAIAGALGSLFWQRRGFVAFIRCQGFRKPGLWRWLLWESSLLLGIGCCAGAAFGVYGQLLLSHALASVTGFPISFDIEALVALSTFALVSVAAVAVVAVPGYLIVRVPPKAASPAS